ncbi:two-component sensor histidine kinase, partial [Betaproteobacteria bacterium PRO4]|nr:two-component sensor histidine kinase [Betaproteobacteria bacterium PRO4]
ILERGARADQSISGHGIGLAIVRDIMQVYEGELLLENCVEQGLCVALCFNQRFPGG